MPRHSGPLSPPDQQAALGATGTDRSPHITERQPRSLTVGPWDAFRFVAEAPQPTVGQLTDDVQSMQNMLADDADPPIAVWHDLAHLIGILNRLAALSQGS
jgi:hypothetical protein